MNNNNFDSVRIGLALIVVFAHIATLTQLQDFNYFIYIFNSKFAVEGFFAISGFLVTKSYLRSKNNFEYAEKRFRRIYPAYLNVVFFCLCISACISSFDTANFFARTETLKYFVYNALFLNFMQPTLSSVFDSNPIQTLNGSLWTIKIEVMLYFFVPSLIYLFNKGVIRTTLLAYVLSVCWVYFFTHLYHGNMGEEMARQFPAQLSYFVFGACFAVNKTILSQLKWLALLSFIMLFATNNSYVKLLIDPIAYSSIVIYLSTAAYTNLNLGKYGDISYGIYLYHFPIIQLLIFFKIFALNAYLGLALVFILTIFTALASWHLIEKRLLKRTSHYIVATQN